MLFAYFVLVFFQNSALTHVMWCVWVLCFLALVLAVWSLLKGVQERRRAWREAVAILEKSNLELLLKKLDCLRQTRPSFSPSPVTSGRREDGFSATLSDVRPHVD